MAVLLIRLLRFAQEKKLSTRQPTTIAAITSRNTMGFRVMVPISFLPKPLCFLASILFFLLDYSNCVA